MRCMINVTPDASASNRDGARNRIDPRVFDRRKVDHQAVITNSQTARVVAAASDGNQETVIAREIHGPHDVCDIHALRDQAWFFVDHPVIHLSGVVIICVARLNQSASEVWFELGDGIFVEHGKRVVTQTVIPGGRTIKS